MADFTIPRPRGRWLATATPPIRLARVARAHHPRLTEGRVVFAVALAVYLAAAAVLVFHLGQIDGDALSRVGNAFYVFSSRDPHLGAIGFVWGPVPAVASMPLLPFRHLFPALVEHGFAANVVSATFMAGAVAQVRRLAEDAGRGRAIRLGAVVAFGLHPMILQHAANGLSEAAFIFLLLWATRGLTSWLATADIRALVRVGTALGLAYLTRYEALGAGLGVVVAVGAVTALRERGAWRTRLSMGALDAGIVAAPFALAVGVWAGISWVLVGNAFEILSSVYGNSSQLALEESSIADSLGTAGPLAYVLRQVVGLAPLLAPALLLALALAWHRRDLRALAAPVVLGSTLALQLGFAVRGETFVWLRFSITAIPLLVVAALFVTEPAAPRRSMRSGALAVVALALLLPSLPVALTTMGRPDLNRGTESAVELLRLPAGDRPADFADEREVARAVDALDLPTGSVLVDTFTAFPIVLASARPRQFVITPDRDFQAALADPPTFGVRYFLLPTPVGVGSLDALNRAWPGVFADGAGVAVLREGFETERGTTWRLYELTLSRA